MHCMIRKGTLLIAALISTLSLSAQQSKPNKMHITSTDVAVLFNLEHAQVAQVNGNTFWLKGGSVDGSVTFFKGLGIAANLTGERASNIQNNVGLGKIAFMVGPRYTFNTSRYTEALTQKHNTQIFGEWLFGGAHAFDSVFPATGGVTSSANGFSMQAGGGVSVALKHGFGFRPLELDWVHTNLSNNAGNSQSGIRIAFGLSYSR